MKNKFYVVALFTLVWGKINAQNEGTLTFMNSLPQVVSNNPALVPKYKIAVGLPGSSIMAFYSNNGFTYNDLITHVHDSVKADLSKLEGALKPKNYMTQAVQIDLFRLGFQFNSRLYITFNSTVKVYNRPMIPKGLMAFFVDGNKSSLGQTVSLSPQAESLSYLETALGGSYRVNNKLTVGARFKYLKGITDVTTQSASLNLTTDKSGYGLTASAGMDVRSSGIYNFTQSNFNFSNHAGDYLNNNGFAIDLGATYHVLDRLTIGASLIDIGMINWKNNTYGYSLDPSKAAYSFQGIDLNKVISGNSSYLNSLGDTLQNKFKVKEGSIGAYNTSIPGKMYLSGMYELKRNLSVGGVFFAEKFQGRTAAGITLGANKHFGKVFSAAASYSIASNSFNNIGAGMSLNLAPVQLYVVGDNLLRMAMSGGELNKYFDNTKFFNVRVGLNFVWDWDKQTRENKIDNNNAKSKAIESFKSESSPVKKNTKNYSNNKKKKKL